MIDKRTLNIMILIIMANMVSVAFVFGRIWGKAMTLIIIALDMLVILAMHYKPKLLGIQI